MYKCPSPRKQPKKQYKSMKCEATTSRTFENPNNEALKSQNVLVWLHYNKYETCYHVLSVFLAKCIQKLPTLNKNKVELRELY